MKILVLGIGYVGTANAVLLAQNNEVVCYDLDETKVDLINKKISPIEDKDLDNYLLGEYLNLKAVSKFPSKDDFAYTVIATPTNYNADTNNFDTSSIESCLDLLKKNKINTTVIIRSTVPVGYIESIKNNYSNEIIFIPEFLREGMAMHDSLYPSRIIVGSHSNTAKKFAELLLEGAKDKNAKVLFTKSTEAESSKLFANAFLALRVSFFNELDSFAISKNLDPGEIIKSISLDPRIGDFYNNPSFGYGGYCLPKDTKQLLRNFDQTPQDIFTSIVQSNETRKDFITSEILKLNPKTLGIYKLAMKEGSDNIRESSVQGIMKRVMERGIEVIIYEPLIKEDYFFKSKVFKSLSNFKNRADLIICNRMHADLEDVKSKIFTRDLYHQD